MIILALTVVLLSIDGMSVNGFKACVCNKNIFKGHGKKRKSTILKWHYAKVNDLYRNNAIIGIECIAFKGIS